MGKSSLLIWCGNLILQKDLHHVYLILRNLLYLIFFRDSAVTALSNKQQNAGMLSYKETNKQSVYIYNREQAPNPHYDWTPENLPVTKLTGCNVSATMLPWNWIKRKLSMINCHFCHLFMADISSSVLARLNNKAKESGREGVI